jgi:serine/threonine-protein kinase
MTLGPYTLVSPLGAGGMGEVWKARDTRLDRIVAIKRLKPDYAERFEREARAIAALNHPHICTLFDVGPDYLVMEYVDGRPLEGPMETGEALRLATQIADALQEAHGRGILHRDLKPSNILVTEKGSAKLLDFGLAKVMHVGSDATMTATGVVAGTPAYMSPEQATGAPLDQRSDIFSFGAVLYELLSGRRAFADLGAVLRDNPTPLSSPASDIVARCLAKEKDRRYQTVTDIRRALAAFDGQPQGEQPSIAVLPFANMSRDPDDDYFSDGLAEEIINALAHMPGLKVTARTSAFAFRGKEQDITQIGQALRVRTILEGSVRRSGNRIRVTAQLISATDGYHLWSERYDRELTDVFAIQDDIARSIAAALEVRLAPKAPRYTPKLPAHHALLQGRHHRGRFTSEGQVRAAECFELAVSLDSGYAAPHAELGLGYVLLAATAAHTMIEVAPLIRAQAEKALVLDPAEGGPHALLGIVASVHDYDWNAAADHFSQATRGDFVTADTRWLYATFYLGAMGQHQLAAEQLRRAVETDPLNVAWRASFAWHLNETGERTQALEELRTALEIDERHWGALVVASDIRLMAGENEEALAAAEEAYRVNPAHSMTWGCWRRHSGASVRRNAQTRSCASTGDRPHRSGDEPGTTCTRPKSTRRRIGGAGRSNRAISSSSNSPGLPSFGRCVTVRTGRRCRAR